METIFKKAMENPSFIELANRFGLQVSYMSGKEYINYWKSQYDETGKMIRALGLGAK